MNADTAPWMDRSHEIARFFDGDTTGYELFERVASTIGTLGHSEIRVSRSQIAFRRGRTFALVWRPSRYVKTTVPIVLSIALPDPIESVRFKEAVHPSPATWMHHLELREASQLDEEVGTWLARAWEAAGTAHGARAAARQPTARSPAMGLHEVDTPAVPLPRLAAVLAPDRAARLAEYQELSRRLLEGRIVWNVNSTAQGGGVAEMLRPLVAYGRGAGIDTRWLVMAGSPDFYAITKRVHNQLHGFAGDGGDLGTSARTLYSERLAAVLPALTSRVRAGDVVLLHDPQTAGLVEPLRSHGARVIWRCHVGADVSNAHTEQAWSFLRGFLAEADAFVFSRRAYAPAWVPEEWVRVVPPSLDPLSPKNAEMTPGELAATLQRIPADDGGPLPGGGRVVLQVSRWDRLKDMAGVLRAFAEHHSELPQDLRLVLAGPEPGRVDDDPEGGEVLAECRELRDALEPALRSRVHLLCLPMDDIVENAWMVNALQRHATVVVQKSLAEGFGLTVTEPMWKSRPVVASAVGGIPDQIVDGESGFLLRDPSDLAGFADLIGSVLSDADRSDRVGHNAHERVREMFLPDRHLIQYVDLFRTLLAG